jgi:hypothetical protein
VSLRSFLEKRLEKGTIIWLAGHLDQPDILGPLLTLGQAPLEVQELVTSIQTFGAGLRFHDGVTLTANLRGVDGNAARNLAAYLHRHTALISAFKIVSSPFRPARPESWAICAFATASPLKTGPLSTAATLVTALAVAGRATQSDEENWVTVQVRAEADFIRQTLNEVSALMPRMSRP